MLRISSSQNYVPDWYSCLVIVYELTETVSILIILSRYTRYIPRTVMLLSLIYWALIT